MKGNKKKITQIFEKNKAVRIDLGCGDAKQPGWIGVDVRPLPNVDIVQDLEVFPWRDIPDDCANLVMASHVVEHINPARGNFIRFMDEVWRILKPGGQFMISAPYAGSPGYWQDPTHVNGCNEITWTYFDPLAKDPSGNPYNLYYIYRPKPWKIANCAFQLQGFMEVLLEKRLVDKSYRVADTGKSMALKKK